jgi:hypothetical protein
MPNIPIKRPDPGEADRYRREMDTILRRMRDTLKLARDGF